MPKAKVVCKERQANISELERVFLSSPLSGQVIQALHQGHSLRHAAEIASVAVNTARKVLAVLQKKQISKKHSLQTLFSVVTAIEQLLLILIQRCFRQGIKRLVR